MERAQEAAFARRAVDALAERDRLALLMREEGLDYEEIAAALRPVGGIGGHDAVASAAAAGGGIRRAAEAREREKGEMQHPDEGTIHAWLDGALSGDEARALEAHLGACAACAAAVTEARGLLAASSRILSALDSVPGGVLPAADAGASDISPARGRSSLWRSPGLRAAAAIVLVGSVSWLATRSTREERMRATETASSPRQTPSCCRRRAPTPAEASTHARR